MFPAWFGGGEGLKQSPRTVPQLVVEAVVRKAVLADMDVTTAFDENEVLPLLNWAMPEVEAAV